MIIIVYFFLLLNKILLISCMGNKNYTVEKLSSRASKTHIITNQNLSHSLLRLEINYFSSNFLPPAIDDKGNVATLLSIYVQTSYYILSIHIINELSFTHLYNPLSYHQAE